MGRVPLGGIVPFARGVFIHRGFSDGERVRGAPRRAPDTPGSRPTKSPLRGSLASVSSLQVGRDTASCLSRPHPRIPAGMTWLVNSGSAILMPDPPPTLDFLCFTERLLSLWDNALNFTSVFFRMPFIAMSISHTHRDTSVTLKNLKVPRGCWTPSHSPRRSREAGASRRDAA